MTWYKIPIDGQFLTSYPMTWYKICTDGPKHATASNIPSVSGPAKSTERSKSISRRSKSKIADFVLSYSTH